TKRGGDPAGHENKLRQGDDLRGFSNVSPCEVTRGNQPGFSRKLWSRTRRGLSVPDVAGSLSISIGSSKRQSDKLPSKRSARKRASRSTPTSPACSTIATSLGRNHRVPLRIASGVANEIGRASCRERVEVSVVAG